MDNRTLAQRLAVRVDKKGPFPSKEAIQEYPEIEGTRCWEYRCNGEGYGNITYNRKIIPAHRVAWELKYSKLPVHKDITKRLCILHKCDNKKCTRPLHLFIGTRRKNMEDKVAKGRQCRGLAMSKALKGKLPSQHGEKNPFAKLRNKDVLKIRNMHSKGIYSYPDLANMFGVTTSNICCVVKRKTFRHI